MPVHASVMSSSCSELRHVPHCICMGLQPFPHPGMSELAMCSPFSCSACDCQLR